MRFMVIIKATKDSEAGVMPSEQLLTEMGKFNEELVKAGVLMAGDGLHPSSKGTRVRYSNETFQRIDGPFAETKELISGFWLIQVKSRDEAIEWARRAPFREGEVEVRPLFELTDFPFDADEKPDGWRDKEQDFRDASPARKPGTIRFMGLLKADKDTEAGVLPDEKVLVAVGEFMEEGVKAGIILSGEGLQPSSTGTRVRFSGSKRTVIDGPFAETKELIAGYLIIQVKSREAAIEWTKQFVTVDAPGRLGAESECELRQLFETENCGAEFSPELREQEKRMRAQAGQRMKDGKR